MNELIIGLICIIFAFASNFYLTKAWIRVCRFSKYMAGDCNKYKKPLVALSGGVPFIMSFMAAVLLYIFFKVFYLNTETNLIFVMALLLTVMLAGFVGFLDDFVMKKGVGSIGLKRWQKPLLTLVFALPLAAVNAGISTVNLPLIGAVNFGIIYPIIIIPLAMMVASNVYNILAGFNGLEGGMGVIILATLGIITWTNGQMWLSLISFISLSAILAYLLFNWFPSKIFPGDSFTYSVGALIAGIAILGNLETIAVILFIPYILDAILLVRAGINGVPWIGAFGIPDKNNYLKLPGKKLYDVAHVAIFVIGKFKKVREIDVVLFILGIEVLLALFCLILFI